MALSPEEEVKLQGIITAFENGKRIDQLPSATNTNPFNLLSEVLEGGESKKIAIATLLPYTEDQCSYGVKYDKTVTSTAVTRIGNSDLHKSLPIQSRMKGCLLKDDGTVQEYLNPNDWLSFDRSGARGQVMVEVPSHYRIFKTVGNEQSCRISEFPLPGYHFVPKFYMSAYEGALDRTSSKLASVVNMAANYRGANNQDTWDGTYRSVLGRPATSISRTNFRNYARARNADTKWNIIAYEQYKTLAWLYYIEYGNRNSQLAFNAARDASGYKQGGLGAGVTNFTSGWDTFNSYSPFIPCGHTDILGNDSGEVAYVVKNEADETVVTTYANRYRGIENIFGHLYKWTDGINIEVKTDADGGTSKVYVCDDPSKFTDANYTGYEMRGLESRVGGYIKEIIFGEKGDIIGSVSAGGGDTSYFADYAERNIASSALRGVLFGGSATAGSAAGLACADSYYAPSAASFGSRLCYIPA